MKLPSYGVVGITRAVLVALLSITVGLVACAPEGGDDPSSASPPQSSEPADGKELPGRPASTTKPTQLTTAQCTDQGGRVVGDPGDGRIYRPGYVCKNGKPPLGAIVPTEGEPIAIEGSVCCLE